MLVTVARYLDITEAEIVRALLESAGIPATVADANHGRVNWPLIVALGGVRLQVPEANQAEALDLVRAYESGDLQRELEDSLGESPECCPACGGQDFVRRAEGSDALLAVGMLVLAGAVFPSRPDQAVCTGCGHRWALGATGPSIVRGI